MTEKENGKKGIFEEVLEMMQGEEPEKGLERLKELAEEGMAEAQFVLGISYEMEGGAELDIDRAAYWVYQAASRGLPDAQFHLATLYDKGIGVYHSQQQAKYWSLKAEGKEPQEEVSSEIESMEEQSEVLRMLYSPSNKAEFENGLNILLEMGENGDLSAQLHLIKIFSSDWSEYVKSDMTKRVYWLQKAAEKNHIDSQRNLAHSYQNGIGLERDINKAFYWYNKSAEQGDKVSQYNVAKMYEDGTGVDKNIESALYWYEEAARNGLLMSQYKLGEFYATDSYKKDAEKAVFWMKQFIHILQHSMHWDVGTAMVCSWSGI